MMMGLSFFRGMIMKNDLLELLDFLIKEASDGFEDQKAMRLVEIRNELEELL